MEVEKVREDLIFTALLVLSIYFILSKLSSPSTLKITYFNGTNFFTQEIPKVYSYEEFIFTIIFSLVAGFCLGYFFFTRKTEFPSREKWEGILKTLEGKEKEVYMILIQNNGVMLQKELLEKTGFPKSTLSVVLDRLEAKGLIERRRRGMSNIVVLK